MATARVIVETTTETENLRQQIDTLAHDLRLEGIRLTEDESALVKLRGEYDQECKALALGKIADPVKIQQRMQPVEARIEGRKGLIAEQHKALVALEGPYATLCQADAQRKQQEELSSLQSDRMKAGERLKQAAEAWAVADKEYAAAVRLENEYIDRRTQAEERFARERR